jgi:hypothetical protein
MAAITSSVLSLWQTIYLPNPGPASVSSGLVSVREGRLLMYGHGFQ